MYFCIIIHLYKIQKDSCKTGGGLGRTTKEKSYSDQFKLKSATAIQISPLEASQDSSVQLVICRGINVSMLW